MDDVSITIDLSTLLAHESPEEVGSILAEAAFALGGREADLARLLGVSRATLSSWKARGNIPAAHLRWFEERFPVEVLGKIASAPGGDFRHAGLLAALHLIRKADFNPFGLRGLSDAELINITSLHFGGLVRLALFIQQRLPSSVSDEGGQVIEEMAANVLGDLARKVAPVLFPSSMVSQ